MFSELPKLFGRDFAISYFLPAALFVSLFVGVSLYYEDALELSNLFKHEPLASLGTGTLVVWVLSVALMAVNTTIIRFFEGYGENNPFKRISYFRNRQANKFLKLQSEIKDLKQECRQLSNEKETVSDVKADKLEEKLNRQAGILGQRQRQMARDFPASIDHILPTSIGNTIRAFEVYSWTVYGLDAIPGWERLCSVVPPSFQSQISSAKASFDFWINLLLLSSFLLVASLFMLGFPTIGSHIWEAFVTETTQLVEAERYGSALLLMLQFSVTYLWIPAGFALACVMSASFGREAAVEWGDWVKSAFDLYRAKLAKLLGYQLPEKSKKERQFWREQNRVFLYRSVEAAGRLNEYRETGDKVNPSSSDVLDNSMPGPTGSDLKSGT